jgi:gliding motility-associated-like protein
MSKKRFVHIRVFILFLISLPLFSFAQQIPKQEPIKYHFLFEENKGQFHDEVIYRCELPTGYLYLEKTGLTYLEVHQGDKAKLNTAFHDQVHGKKLPALSVRHHAFKVNFNHSERDATIDGYAAKEYYYNYYIGSDQTKWATDVNLFEALVYHNIYPFIDLLFYMDHKGSLKYEWHIREGGNINDIEIEYTGLESISIVNDSLKMSTSISNTFESPPIAFAYNDDDMKSPKCSFELDGNKLHYKISSPLDSFDRIIIDPELIFSTYSGSRGDNFGFTATYDSRGNLYAGGIVDNQRGEYPITTGAFQKKFGGGVDGVPPANLLCDISISKYDSAGTQLLFATYIGGAHNEFPHSLVVDSSDNLIIYGTTHSDNYPTTSGAYDTAFNGNVDIIVSKLTKDGRNMIGSTYLGGTANDGHTTNSPLNYNYADDYRGDVIPDGDGNIYIASVTRSDVFPLVNASDTTFSIMEGVAAQFNSDLTELLWCTYVGGNKQDALYSIKLDVDGNVYVGGGTTSDDLKTTSNALKKKKVGGIDGMVAAFSQASKGIKSFSYWGTTSYDQIYFVDIDNKGALYIAGQTTGNIKPSSGVYGKENRGQYVAKLDTGLSKVIFQTSFGDNVNEIDFSPTAFLVDNCEHIYMSGWASEVYGGIEHPGSADGLEIKNPLDPNITTDGHDFYIIVLDKNASDILFATTFGGDSTRDHVDGGTSRFDKRGIIYQSVCSSCPNEDYGGFYYQDFPVSPSAAFTENLSYRCSNASFKIDLQITSGVKALFRPDPDYGCNPLDITFTNFSSGSKKFIWDFGDGTKDSTTKHPVHTYNQKGVYIVSLTVIDSNSCNVSDYYERTVEVIDRAPASFEYENDACKDIFTFKSTSDAEQIVWDLGDGYGTPSNEFKYEYKESGEYRVQLITNPHLPCPDTVVQIVNVNLEEIGKIIIPNIFTPNGDPYNDCFYVEGLSRDCDEMEWWIYNRWGEAVFHSKDPSACWDGVNHVNETRYPEGTYFSVFKIKRTEDGPVETISGTVTLIRD